MRRKTWTIMATLTLIGGIGVYLFSYFLRPIQTDMQIAQNRKAEPHRSTEGPVAAGAGSPGNAAARAVSVALNVSSGQTNSDVVPGARQFTVGLTDGVYTGDRVDAFYGYVRVQAIVQNGTIQRVRVLEHPNDNGTSRYINGVAMPYLVQEAIQAQSSNISLISGATFSSEAFVKSLDSALLQAGT